MAKIFLVDTENVNIRALKGANYLDENDLIILFTTNKTIVHNFHENLESGVKNFIYFQIVSCLGLVIGTNNKKNMEYYIISRDKGYLHSINFLYEQTQCSINLIPNIKSLFDKNYDDTLAIMENMDDEITQCLKELGYTNKTITKALIAIDSSKTEKDLEVNFFLQFGWNNKIYNICKPIIFKYNILNIA